MSINGVEVSIVHMRQRIHEFDDATLRRWTIGFYLPITSGFLIKRGARGSLKWPL